MEKQSETRYMQLIVGVTAALSGPIIVAHLNWPSPALPMLQSSDSPFGEQITDEEGSWIVSILYIAILPGGLIGGFLAEKVGRKTSLLVGGVISLIAWIIIISFKNIIALYISRGIGGISLGIIASINTIYYGEIADDEIRGMIGVAAYLLNPVTSMIVLAAGPYMPYIALNILCGAMPAIFIVSFVWAPETPHYFIKKGKIDEAKRSLIRLSPRNTSEDSINKRIIKLQETIISDNSKNRVSLYQFVSNWKHMKPFCLMTGLQVLYLLCGNVAIEAYMQTIIEASNSSLSPEMSSLIFGIVKIPPVIAAIILCDRVGRRPLYTISAIGAAISLFGEGVYFYIHNFHEDFTSNISWLPTTALAIFMIMVPIGLGPVPNVLTSEMFPSETKEISAALLQVFMGITSFTVTKTFAPLSNALGAHTLFWFFAIMCLVNIAYIYMFIPETKGKSFAEIQEEIYGKKNAPLERNV